MTTKKFNDVTLMVKRWVIPWWYLGLFLCFWVTLAATQKKMETNHFV